MTAQCEYLAGVTQRASEAISHGGRRKVIWLVVVEVIDR